MSGVDEWISFDKYTSRISAERCALLLKQSSRFRNVECMSLSRLRSLEGVDAIITAELQIAGSWPITEQRSIREQIQKSTHSLEWVLGQFQELMDLLGDMLEADPSIANLTGQYIPKRIVKGLMEGERNAQELLMPKRRKGYTSMRWPTKGGDHYMHLNEKVLAEFKISFSALVCVLLELWEVASPEERTAAFQRVLANGVVPNKRPERADL